MSKDNKKNIVDVEVKDNDGLIIVVINKSERKFLVNELLNIIKNIFIKK